MDGGGVIKRYIVIGSDLELVESPKGELIGWADHQAELARAVEAAFREGLAVQGHVATSKTLLAPSQVVEILWLGSKAKRELGGGDGIDATTGR